jgi:K+-transporting ATPase c subunit
MANDSEQVQSASTHDSHRSLNTAKFHIKKKHKNNDVRRRDVDSYVAKHSVDVEFHFAGHYNTNKMRPVSTNLKEKWLHSRMCQKLKQ